MSEANRSTAVDDDGSGSFADEDLTDAAALVAAWDFEAARQVLDDALDDPGPYPWDALRLRAVVRRELGDLAGALADAQRAADGSDARYGPVDPDTVQALAVVGMVRHDLGHWDVAEALYHRVLDSGVDEDGPAGRAVRLTRANFALLQRDRGDTAMALILLNAAYAVHRREYGPDDLDTVRIAAELAEAHRDAGDLTAARRLFAVAHAGASTRLGESHPFTRTIEDELAAVEPVMPTPLPISAPPARRRWLRRHATPATRDDSLDDEESPIGRLPTGWPEARHPSGQHPATRPPVEWPPAFEEEPDRPPADAAPTVDQPLVEAWSRTDPTDPAPEGPSPSDGSGPPHDGSWPTGDWARPAELSTRDDPFRSLVDAGGEWWPSEAGSPPVRPAGPVPWQRLLIFGASALVAVVVGVVAVFLVQQARGVPRVAAPAASAGERASGVPLGPMLKDDGESLTVTWAAQPLDVVVALSRAGGAPTVVADLPAGATSYVVRGLDRTARYCVVIGTVVDGAPLSAATSVCTRR